MTPECSKFPMIASKKIHLELKWYDINYFATVRCCTVGIIPTHTRRMEKRDIHPSIERSID